jgi:hypothetical protein
MSTHTLIVSHDPLSPAEQYEYDHGDAGVRRDMDRDRRRVTIECSGVDQTCHAWIECMERHDWSDEQWDDGEAEAHGEHHQNINAMWCVESGKCSVDPAFHDWWYESAEELADQLGVGRWPITFTWEDEYVLIERARELADARAS